MMYLAQYMTGEGSTGVGEGEVGRSEGSGRQGTIYLACKPSDTKGYIVTCIGVGVDARFSLSVLSVSTPTSGKQF